MAKSAFTWTNQGPIHSTAREVAFRAALEIERDTKMRCPVDTGNLRRSYVTQPQSSPADKTQVFLVGTNVNYAMFVEFGTSKMQAQPHLGPALAKAKVKYG
jgi:HK97 gp10 family phage protein